VKSIHSDNGGEYTPVKYYAEQNVIRVTRAMPYKPQSNGIAERTNITLVEAVRTTLKQSGLAKEFWAESLENVVTVQNCIPKKDGVSPYEMLNNRKPTFDRFRPFGCRASVHLHESKRKKLDTKSLECVLMRTLDHGNYRLYDCSNNSIVVSRHFKFSENIFPKKLQPENDTAETESESENHDSGMSENTSDGQSDLSVPDLFDTNTEYDSNSGVEHSDGAATESNSSVEEKVSDNNNGEKNSDNESISSHDTDTEETQSTTRRYPERQRSKLWYLDLTVRGASSARGQRDCKHTPVLALLACEVEGCGACGEGDGRRESTSLPRKRK
jgi:hypothetical protein